MIKTYYIQGRLHWQKDIWGFIGVIGLNCLKKTSKFLYLICAYWLNTISGINREGESRRQPVNLEKRPLKRVCVCVCVCVYTCRWDAVTHSLNANLKNHLVILTCRGSVRFHAAAAARFWTSRSSCCCRTVERRPCEWCASVHENCHDCEVEETTHTYMHTTLWCP